MSSFAGLGLCLTLLAAMGAPLAGDQGRTSPLPLGVTVPVKVNGESGTTPRTYIPGAVLADPSDPTRVYVAVLELRSRRCGFLRSNDGGRTWAAGASPSPPAYPFCSNTTAFMPMGSLAIGSGGSLYYLHRAWSHHDDGPNPNSSVFLSRSDDGGGSWQSRAVRDARPIPPPSNEVNFPFDVVVDTSGDADIIYVSWTATYPSAVPNKANQPMLSVSSDGGRTFSDPINLSGTYFDDPAHMTGDIPPAFKRKEHFGGASPHLAMGGSGILWATWTRQTINVDGALPQPRYLSRTSDGGRTFTVTEMAAASPINDVGAVLEWTPAGGPEGTLHTVYEDKAGGIQGDRDVHYRRSTDGGATWSAASVLNDDDPLQLFSQLLPTIAAAPNGRLDVAWWDTRHGLDRYATDVYYSFSHDAGSTWSSNVRLTERSVNRRVGSWVDNFGDTRRSPALTSSDALGTVLWEATGNDTDPTQDLYASSVQFAPLVEHQRARMPLYTGAALGGATAGVGTFLLRRRFRRTAPDA